MPAAQRETIPDLEQLERDFQRICSKLVYPPGSIFRIASQYLPNWGIKVTPENAPFIEARADANNYEEWKRGNKASNTAIERATQNAQLPYGNTDLNYDVGILSAELMMRLAETRDTIRILDLGAGTGDTTTTVLMFLEMLEGCGDALRKSHFYLLEPSIDRLGDAKKAIEDHSINSIGPVDFTLVASSQRAHFPFIAPGTFDLVYSSAVFHHLTSTAFLKELNGIMAQDGVLVLGDWYTAIWEHPVFVADLVQRLGMETESLREFLALFDISKKGMRDIEGALEPHHKLSNKMMMDFEMAIAKEFQLIPPQSRLFFLEGHETLQDRMVRLAQNGFETDLDELRDKHRAFASHKQNIQNLFPGSDFATAVAAAKIPGHRPKSDADAINARIKASLGK